MILFSPTLNWERVAEMPWLQQCLQAPSVGKQSAPNGPHVNVEKDVRRMREAHGQAAIQRSHPGVWCDSGLQAGLEKAPNMHRKQWRRCDPKLHPLRRADAAEGSALIEGGHGNLITW